ncbi:MAG: endolytic transglycosylase MltG [Ferruginibacter sp.]
MKKIVVVAAVVILVGVIYAAWQLFGPTINADEKYFYIKTGSTYTEVKKSLQEKKIIASPFFFDKVAGKAGYKAIRPGRYELKEGSNLISLVRMLKGGRQSPVKLVINKLRTKEDFAAKIGANFEADSAAVMTFMLSKDSLTAYGLDSNTSLTTVIPDTYLITWNGGFKKIFTRLQSEHDKFWNNERMQKASRLQMSPQKIYTIASIVEEETNKKEDKPLIASVYINRLRKGMRLEADPTVKYAMRNFGLKRILRGHLQYPSPYNTYQNMGLPPGPISTATGATIDAVLEAPVTDYIFFVAKPDFKGYSNFAATYVQHMIYAKAYQKALDSLIISKNKN